MDIKHTRGERGWVVESSEVQLGPNLYHLSYGNDQYYVTDRGFVPYEALTEFQKGVFDEMRTDQLRLRIETFGEY